jgi:glucose-6-phosphate isomerase
MSNQPVTDLEQIAPNLFRKQGDLGVLLEADIERVVAAATAHPLGRARINFHGTDEDLVHEMVIAMTPRSSGAPHLHHSKSESFHLISGSLGIGFYDAAGRLDRAVLLSEGAARFYRLSGPTAHMPIALSEVAVFHETTNGPFVKGVSSTTPQWAERMSTADVERLEIDLKNRLGTRTRS